MSEFVARMPKGLVRRLGAAPEPRVSFAELVWAHHLRQEALARGAPYEGEDEQRYRSFHARFEAEHGPIVASYWCRHEASASALTVKPVGRLRAFFGAEDSVRLHRATDWATKDMPEIAEQLRDCETLAIRVAACLQDTSLLVAIQRLHSLVSYLLGFVDGVDRRGAGETKRAVQYARAELARIDDYYRRSGERAGQLVYMGGMFAGLLPVLVLGFLLLNGIGLSFDVSNGIVATAYACSAAGALGALVSVMSRLSSGRLDVDYDFGKDTVRRFGLLRPWLGALLGFMMYFALKSEVLGIQLAQGANSFYFYVLFAFLAGFSERFARDVLLGAGERAAPGAQGAALAVTGPAPPPAAPARPPDVE